MAFIEKENFHGSEVANIVTEALDYGGLLEAMNNCTYAISIDGICDIDSAGRIDDSPSLHKIVISRSKYVGNMSRKQYNSYETSDIGKAEMKKHSDVSLVFENVGESFENKHYFNRDKQGYVWYNHEISFFINRPITESFEGYVQRMFNTISQYIIDTLKTNSSNTRR